MMISDEFKPKLMFKMASSYICRVVLMTREFINHHIQGIMYKKRVKNDDRKIFEIPALLVSQQGNPEQENSK